MIVTARTMAQVAQRLKALKFDELLQKYRLRGEPLRDDILVADHRDGIAQQTSINGNKEPRAHRSGRGRLRLFMYVTFVLDLSSGHL